MKELKPFRPSGLVLDLRPWGTDGNRRGVVPDASGKGHSGQLNRWALSLDGGNDTADAAGALAVGAGDCCIEAWIGSYTADGTLFFNEDASGNDHVVTFQADGTIRFTYPGAGTNEAVVSVDVMTAATFPLFVRCKAVSGVATIEVNGVDVTDEAAESESVGVASCGVGSFDDVAYWGGTVLLLSVATSQLHDRFRNPRPSDVSGYVAFWDMVAGTGNPADASGNGNTLTLAGATWSAAAPFGQTWRRIKSDGSASEAGDRFTGAGVALSGGVNDNQFVTVANHADLIPGAGAFQLHVWARIASSAPDGGILVGKGAVGATEFMFRIGSGGSATKLAMYAAAGNIACNGDANIKDNALHLFSAIRAGSSLSIYVDTASVGTDATAGDDLSSAADLVVGGNALAGDRELMATVYRVLFGKAALSAAAAVVEMGRLYRRGPWR